MGFLSSYANNYNRYWDTENMDVTYKYRKNLNSRFSSSIRHNNNCAIVSFSDKSRTVISDYFFFKLFLSYPWKHGCCSLVLKYCHTNMFNIQDIAFQPRLEELWYRSLQYSDIRKKKIVTQSWSNITEDIRNKLLFHGAFQNMETYHFAI